MWGRRSVSRVGRPTAALALLCVVAFVGSACSKGASGPPEYSLFAQKFRFRDMPSSVDSGTMIISFTNRESLPILHEMILLGLPQGQTADDVVSDAKAKGPDAEGDYLSFGEIGEVATGSTKAQTFDLPAGNYVLACFETGNLGDPEAEGKAHAARGMVFQFTVT